MDVPYRIADLHGRHPGITQGRAASYYEAACVCFERHHAPDVTQISIIDNNTVHTANVAWLFPSEATKAAWAGVNEATEHGATCCVLAAVEATRNFLAVRRADIGIGADYYVGPPGAGTEDLEDCVRVEISGVDAGNEAEVNRRLAEKVKQASNGRSSLPAVAGVIGFHAKLLLLRDVQS